MKFYTALLLSVAAIVNVVAVVLLATFSAASPAQANTPTTSLRVTVKDGDTDAPIKEATVCVLETKSYYQTDADGLTTHITVPYLLDNRFGDALKPTSGEITLLVYKTGYADVLLMHCQTYPDRTRLGPTITLYPADGSLSNYPLIETPDEDYIRRLIDRYKK